MAMERGSQGGIFVLFTMLINDQHAYVFTWR